MKNTSKTLTDSQLNIVINRYQSGETAESIAKDYGCIPCTISRALRRVGIATRKTTKIVFTEENKEKIISLAQEGWWGEDIAKELGCSGATILRALDSWGIERKHRVALRGPKGNAITFNPSERETIKNRYLSGESLKEIAPTIGCSTWSVKKLLVSEGIEIRLLRPKVTFTNQETEKIIKLYTDKVNLDDIAEIFNCSRNLIARILREQGILIRQGRLHKHIDAEGKKICRKCGEEKLTTDFSLHNGTYDGVQAVCRKCSGASSRVSRLKAKFDLTPEEYDAMHTAQQGLCAICGKPETRKRFGTLTLLVVDHNHITGEVRELLCSSCNVAIGSLKDSVENCLSAALYLERHSKGVAK